MRFQLLRGVRRVDAVLTALLCVLGLMLMVLNIVSVNRSPGVDWLAWLMLPVFWAATVPVLWWRRSVVGALLVACVAMAVHVVAFGTLVRCGAGLPLAFVLAFLSGLVDGPRRRLVALALSGVLCALVLVRDAAAGIGLLPVTLALCAGLFGLARVFAHRAALGRDLEQHNADLRRLRDERSALEVNLDRLQLSARLETLLDQRLRQLQTAAESGVVAGDAEATRALLVTLEDDSRQTLDDMREIVGLLRGGEVALAPVPSVAHLDALLARHLRAGSRLQVSGDPRILPASVELSAYRIVEHLVTAFADHASGSGGGAGVGVQVTFTDAALEIRVSGPATRGADLRAAVGRARERALLHAGSLNVRTVRGQSQVVALLPVLGGT